MISHTIAAAIVERLVPPETLLQLREIRLNLARRRRRLRDLANAVRFGN